MVRRGERDIMQPRDRNIKDNVKQFVELEWNPEQGKGKTEGS